MSGTLAISVEAAPVKLVSREERIFSGVTKVGRLIWPCRHFKMAGEGATTGHTEPFTRPLGPPLRPAATGLAQQTTCPAHLCRRCRARRCRPRWRC